MTDRFVGVVGVGRCGSSMIAGMLHRAGVQMGLPGHLIGPHNEWNVLGHYEDECWHYLNRVVAYYVDPHRDILERETTRIYPEIVKAADEELWTIYAEHIAQHRAPLWGMKCIFLGLIWDHVRPMIEGDKRLIMVHRRWSGIIESRMAHMGINRQEAEQITGYMYQRIHEQLLHACVPVLHVQYEQVINDPKGEAARILQFAAGDEWARLDMARVVKFPERRLRHYA